MVSYLSQIGKMASKRIGDILIEGAFISPGQIKNALEYQAGLPEGGHEYIGQILVKQGAVTPETLATLLSFQLNVHIVDLKQYRIMPEALELVPCETAMKYNILPLAVVANVLTLATEEPQNLEVIDKLAALTGKRIKPVIPLHGFDGYIEKAYRSRVPQAYGMRAENGFYKGMAKTQLLERLYWDIMQNYSGAYDPLALSNLREYVSGKPQSVRHFYASVLMGIEEGIEAMVPSMPSAKTTLDALR